jgi:hypothetical protein
MKQGVLGWACGSTKGSRMQDPLPVVCLRSAVFSGGRISNTSNVTAMATTPSLKAMTRAGSRSAPNGPRTFLGYQTELPYPKCGRGPSRRRRADVDEAARRTVRSCSWWLQAAPPHRGPVRGQSVARVQVSTWNVRFARSPPARLCPLRHLFRPALWCCVRFVVPRAFISPDTNPGHKQGMATPEELLANPDPDGV